MEKINDIIKMMLFSKIKSGNGIYDAIILTSILTLIGCIVKKIDENEFNINEINIIEYLRYFFYTKNTLIMTGRKCTGINWEIKQTINYLFGDQFKAVWDEIINNIEKNSTIYEIKDFLTMSDSVNNTYLVSQKKSFLFNKEHEIYALTKFSTEESKNDDSNKSLSKIDNIEIILYSYKSSLSQIKQYIDKLTKKYTDDIVKSRINTKFIYTLIKIKYEDYKFECWKESCFDTTRSFNNMFFEGKKNIIDKIDFFLTNKEWYYSKGIPYTLGFGLHGPPGTGKTSFIKSLAKYTNRHIIILSLKLIKTRRQLYDFFYEDVYNSNNKNNNIGFNKKIIVIEDIDAQGDIVLDRSKNMINVEKLNVEKLNVEKLNVEKLNMGNVIKTLINDKEKIENNLITVLKPTDDEPITLDDILNLWDGIEETCGRILVISSNHYKDLDPAITRPGRIDVSLEMNNVSHEILTEMYLHLYEKNIDPEALNKIKSKFYSPAEIVNLYLMHKNDESAFVNRLMENKKII